MKLESKDKRFTRHHPYPKPFRMGRLSQDQIEDEIKGMLLVVIAEAKDENAKSYADAGATLTGKELKVQVLYVLNNLQYWRGETARYTKARLKRLNKGLK